MGYFDEDLDIARVRRYAERVARERESLASTWYRDTEDISQKRMFSTKVIRQPVTRNMDGWALLRSGQGGNVVIDPRTTHVWEFGSALILKRDGTLRFWEFRQTYYSNAREKVERLEIGSDTLAESADIKVFDWIAQPHWRNERKQKDEYVRQVINTHGRVSFAHPGMATTLALKSLLERSHYISEFCINY